MTTTDREKLIEELKAAAKRMAAVEGDNRLAITAPHALGKRLAQAAALLKEDEERIAELEREQRLASYSPGERP